MSWSDWSEKRHSSDSDELQFKLDEYYSKTRSSSAEKTVSPTGEIRPTINNTRDCLLKNRYDRGGFKRTSITASLIAFGADEVVVPTTDHDSFKRFKSVSGFVVKNKSNGSETGSCSMIDEAWDRLRSSFVDPSGEDSKYNQVFVRDFVPTALACLMKAPDPEPDIVKDFLLKSLHHQGWKKKINNFTIGEGAMAASDFGGSAIGRVASVDSGLWWIILLRSYTKCTGDYTLSEQHEVQKRMKLILDLCLSDGFDTIPTLLCADGCSMIDRRMGIYGYPIEIQALFFFALRCAQKMLIVDADSIKLIEQIERRITALSDHIRNYYWLDFTQLNNIYRYKTEEYAHTAVNKFNVIPESIPDWVFDFMPLKGGYFIGNVSPARMDFRWFLVGNCIAILSSLATVAQTTAIMDLVEERWEDLIGDMPLKIAFPALEGYERNIVTGCDPKNTRWSNHNGGSWPVLLWLLTAACIKVGRPQVAMRAIKLVEQRLSKDKWPEYYDGKKGRYVGKQARKYQTWSISGYLVAKLLIENPSNLAMISLEEDKKIEKARLTRSASLPCSRGTRALYIVTRLRNMMVIRRAKLLKE
ncbi:hypothetical protein QVD17_04347 [Tagetes erecta]|uniref:Alkaline/neutral invertase n=1 Tax=Tagetes erecta TaxID=13708 RepID=A0AAD8LCL1_TARER|nr:hypothetical protein QVD17_04347 [Tagetes erecta]